MNMLPYIWAPWLVINVNSWCLMVVVFKVVVVTKDINNVYASYDCSHCGHNCQGHSNGYMCNLKSLEQL
jgi:hypothetical protein